MAEFQIEDDELSKTTAKFAGTLMLDSSPPPSTSFTNQHDDEEEEDEEENEEFEFSFMGGGDLSSPVAAEEVFKDGQIRIISPIISDEEKQPPSGSNGPPVKKVFVVSENGDVAEGPYCVWKSPVPEMSQKSNSTGFSKLWKVRDLLARSNSDGKDAFVFLTGKSDVMLKKKKKKVETTAFGGEKKEKKKSAYEELYGGGKDKKKSYLPYKQDLVGFFANGSAFSRNLHPY